MHVWKLPCPRSRVSGIMTMIARTRAGVTYTQRSAGLQSAARSCSDQGRKCPKGGPGGATGAVRPPGPGPQPSSDPKRKGVKLTQHSAGVMRDINIFCDMFMLLLLLPLVAQHTVSVTDLLSVISGDRMSVVGSNVRGHGSVSSAGYLACVSQPALRGHWESGVNQETGSLRSETENKIV